MEGRALLTSAAVSAAITAVQQGETTQQASLSQEISTLQSNIVSIEDATTTYITKIRADIQYRQQDEAANSSNETTDRADIAADRKYIKDATRDEKYAIHQQGQPLRQLHEFSRQVTAFDAAQVKGLNDGDIDPTTGTDTSSNYTDYIQVEITAIDTQAQKDLAGLIGTLNGRDV